MLVVSLTNAKNCGTFTKMPNNIFDELDALKKKKKLTSNNIINILSRNNRQLLTVSFIDPILNLVRAVLCQQKINTSQIEIFFEYIKNVNNQNPRSKKIP